MLEFLIVLLILGWLLGFSMHIAGGLIHILLVIAVIAIIFRVFQGRSL
jgi:hypothetical protein